MSDPRPRIVITGMGCVCAAGGTLPDTLDALFAGRRRHGTRDVKGVSYPIFGIADEDAPARYYEVPECQRCGRLATHAAVEAFGQSGYGDKTGGVLQACRVGVCVGTTIGNTMSNEEFCREFLVGNYPDVAPIREYLRANPASMVAKTLSLRGPLQTVTNACSSSTVAIGQAADWIASGVCDVAVAGGADMLSNVTHTGFLSLMITDSELCRPFDLDRRGLNLGEGAGMLVLESESRARARGARVLAYLRGYGNSADAYHISAPNPDGSGLRRAVLQALEEAGLSPSDLAFINAHGTGTHGNDRVEGLFFDSLFPDTPVSATKGYTGHTLGASGAIEAALTVSFLTAGRIPASAGFETSDPEFHTSPVSEITVVEGRYAMSDSVAFGGNNAVLIFERGDT